VSLPECAENERRRGRALRLHAIYTISHLHNNGSLERGQFAHAQRSTHNKEWCTWSMMKENYTSVIEIRTSVTPVASPTRLDSCTYYLVSNGIAQKALSLSWMIPTRDSSPFESIQHLTGYTHIESNYGWNCCTFEKVFRANQEEIIIFFAADFYDKNASDG